MNLVRVVAIALVAVFVAACGGAAPDASGTPSAAGGELFAGSLRVLTPSNGDIVETASVTFAGTAPAGSTVIQDISLAGDREVVATDGTWTLDVDLDEGVNEVTLRLGDDRSTEQTIRLTYAPATAAATSIPTPEPTAAPTPKPTPAPTAKPTPKPTPVEYKKLSMRSWRKVVKAPDDYIGRTYQIWACIWQFDAATGPESFLGQAGPKRLEYWYSEGENASFTGDADRLSDFVEGDIVVMNVTVAGSYSYDTQAGGNTTVPSFLVNKITRKGDCS
jgi:hypothetical protein